MLKLEDKHVLVTGGSGFLGRQIVEKLRKRGTRVSVVRKRVFDLTSPNQALMCMSSFKPDVVIHCAAFYGGLGINRKYPGQIYYENLLMGANVIEACRQHDVEKFVGVGTACSYPGYLEGELREEDLWGGPCHESVRCYGMTKKMMQIQCEAYNKQWGFNGIHLLLANLYGEWDSYNPERSHVVAALIRKFVEAKMNNASEVVVWGTGKPIREFLYVGDAADAIIEATRCYDDVRPLNVGTGVGTSIRELVELICELSGFKGKVVWDSSKPDGQAKKVFDVSRITSLFWKPKTTVRCFEDHVAFLEAQDDP